MARAEAGDPGPDRGDPAPARAPDPLGRANARGGTPSALTAARTAHARLAAARSRSRSDTVIPTE